MFYFILFFLVNGWYIVSHELEILSIRRQFLLPRQAYVSTFLYTEKDAFKKGQNQILKTGTPQKIKRGLDNYIEGKKMWRFCSRELGWVGVVYPAWFTSLEWKGSTKVTPFWIFSLIMLTSYCIGLE